MSDSLIEFANPVCLSRAVTSSTQLLSMANVTSICGSPFFAGRMP